MSAPGLAAPEPPHPEPHIIEGARGPLFAVYYPAQGEASGRAQGVLVLPPFAEEMNRSRRMMALLGRRLSARGVAVLVLDLHGTGDSGGDFSEARWDLWLSDAAAALAWLKPQAPGGLALLGLRLGACLALELAKAAEAPDGLALDRVILWNPVLRGDLMLNQFLRVRALAGIGQDETGTEDTGGETAKDLRARLRAGETLEVAGYALHPDLADGLEGLRLARLGEGCPAPIDWFELAAEEASRPAPASASAIEALRAAGVSIALTSVPGEPFWSIEETVVVEPLLARTAALWPA